MKERNEKRRVTNLERGKRRRGEARLLETMTVEAVVARAMSVNAMQQQSRRLILTDLTAEIASRRNLCSVRRFKQRQLPLITAKLERDSSTKPIDPCESDSSVSAAATASGLAALHRVG